MKDAIAARTMTEQLRRSLTWDRCEELAQCAQLKSHTGVVRTPSLGTFSGVGPDAQRALLAATEALVSG